MAVLQGIAKARTDSRFTDFTINTRDCSFDVHRLIISLHSSVLAKACQGSFRETSRASIDLLDDDPRLVEGMVDYFYRYCYLLYEPRNKPHYHIGMAIIADKYDVQVRSLRYST